MSDYRTPAEIAADENFVATMTAPERCRLCGDRLTSKDDDKRRGYCWSCKTRPEAQIITQPPRPQFGFTDLRPKAQGAGPVSAATRPSPKPRSFTAADKALIRSLTPHLPAADVLRILNERLEADDPDAKPYTLERLRAEVSQAALGAGGGWSDLRRILNDARRAGVLEQVTPQVIDDFAVCFQLSPAQVTQLKDVLAHAKESR